MRKMLLWILLLAMVLVPLAGCAAPHVRAQGDAASDVIILPGGGQGRGSGRDPQARAHGDAHTHGDAHARAHADRHACAHADAHARGAEGGGTRPQ